MTPYLNVLDDLWIQQSVELVIFWCLSMPLFEQILVPEEKI